MKKVFFLVAAAVAVLSMSSCSKQKEHLVGVIPEWGNDTLFVKYVTLSGQDGYEVLYAQDGRFAYTLTDEEPVIFTIFNPADFVAVGAGYPFIPDSKTVKVFLSPKERIKVTGNALADVVEYEVRGSKLAESMNQMRQELLPEQIKADAREVEILRSAVDQDAEGQYKLYVERQELIRKMQKAELDFALRNMDKEVAAFVLSTQPLDTLRKYEPQLPSKIRNEGLFSDIFDRRLSLEPISVEVPEE